jgi:hypothetical protein
MCIRKAVLSDDQGTVLHGNVRFPIDICYNNDGTPNLSITENVNTSSIQKCFNMVVDKCYPQPNTI